MNVNAKVKLRDTIIVGPFAHYCESNLTHGADADQVDSDRKDLEARVKHYLDDYSGNEADFEVKHFEDGVGIDKNHYVIMLHKTNIMVAEEMVSMIHVENPWNIPVGALS